MRGGAEPVDDAHVVKKLAIIDDYEHAALESADWSTVGDDVEITVFHDHLEDEDAVAERLQPFHLVSIMRERTPFPASLLARLPKLELLVTSGMRNASIDLEAARSNGVVVTGTPILPYPAAEHAWALIIALAKRMPADDRNMRAGRWGDALNVGLYGKTLGVIGLGRLGPRVAGMGQAFGMNVVAWSRNLTRARCEEFAVTLVSREELFATADFVTVHLTLGERSRGLIDASDFARMKPTAYFINTSRGPIVEEAALIEALQSGRIAGAGLDVYDIEPLPADNPLRSLPNTVLTPHTGYVTKENYEVFFTTTVANIRAWLDGEPINVLS